MFVEPIAAFFRTSGFGESVTLDGQARNAIFDNAHELAPFTAAAVGGIATSQPMLTLATADVPASPVGKAAVVANTTYTVVEHQPDGTGVSRLMLERT